MKLFAEPFIVSKGMPKDCLMIVQEGAVELDFEHAQFVFDDLVDKVIVPIKYDLSRVSTIRCIGWAKNERKRSGRDKRKKWK